MDNEGEGFKFTPPVVEPKKIVTVIETPRMYDKTSFAKTIDKPVQKKLLGLSKWVWFVAGAIVIFAILTIVIVINAH